MTHIEYAREIVNTYENGRNYTISDLAKIYPNLTPRQIQKVLQNAGFHHGIQRNPHAAVCFWPRDEFYFLIQ